MAKNLVHDEDRYIAEVAATDPATAESGDPVLVGNIPGVALVDEGDGGNATGMITIDRGGIWKMPVVGASGAIAVGDILYLDGGELNDDDSGGTRWGYALGTVGSGATAVIDVLVGY